MNSSRVDIVPDEPTRFLLDIPVFFSYPVPVLILGAKLKQHSQTEYFSCGIGKQVYYDTFRYLFPTQLLEGTCDIRAIQEPLGHSYPDITVIYTQVFDKGD